MGQGADITAKDKVSVVETAALVRDCGEGARNTERECMIYRWK